MISLVTHGLGGAFLLTRGLGSSIIATSNYPTQFISTVTVFSGYPDPSYALVEPQ